MIEKLFIKNFIIISKFVALLILPKCFAMYSKITFFLREGYSNAALKFDLKKVLLQVGFSQDHIFDIIIISKGIHNN